MNEATQTGGDSAGGRVTSDLGPGRVLAWASLREAMGLSPVDSSQLAGTTHEARARWVERLESVRKNVAVPAPSEPSSLSVARAFEARTSTRAPGQPPGWVLTELLYLMSHVTSQMTDTAGRTWSSRAFPSAGGVHSIEPLLYVEDVPGWSRGWYVQTGPELTQVNEVEVPVGTALIAGLQAALRDSEPPPAAIFGICEPEMILDRYPPGTSLMWRDAGVFLGAAQIAAIGYGVTSTPAGICIEVDAQGPVVPDDEGIERLPVCALGALALGGPADVRSPTSLATNSPSESRGD